MLTFPNHMWPPIYLSSVPQQSSSYLLPHLLLYPPFLEQFYLVQALEQWCRQDGRSKPWSIYLHHLGGPLGGIQLDGLWSGGGQQSIYSVTKCVRVLSVEMSFCVKTKEVVPSMTVSLQG